MQIWVWGSKISLSLILEIKHQFIPLFVLLVCSSLLGTQQACEASGQLGILIVAKGIWTQVTQLPAQYAGRLPATELSLVPPITLQVLQNYGGGQEHFQGLIDERQRSTSGWDRPNSTPGKKCYLNSLSSSDNALWGFLDGRKWTLQPRGELTLAWLLHFFPAGKKAVAESGNPWFKSLLRHELAAGLSASSPSSKGSLTL